MRRRLSLFCTIYGLLAVNFISAAQESFGGVLFEEMHFEALPDLNIPRVTHSLVAVGNDVLAIGGHTKGFVPTATAEYLENGKWKLVETTYLHDGAMALKLRNGTVFIAGGYAGDFGIGQSFGVDLYDPEVREFRHMPIMDNKRTHCSALELDSGEILISGNWYAPDNMEIYTPGQGGRTVKAVSQERTEPWLLRSGQDNALVFGLIGNFSDTLRPLIVDRLVGDPFTPELFDQWYPIHTHQNIVASSEYEIGNYSYLIPVRNDAGEYAPMMVSGEEFTLLRTEHPIPAGGPWGQIVYVNPFFTDKDTETAWLPGTDLDGRIYLVKLCYGPALRGGKAPVRVYYTKPVPRQESPRFELLPGGRFIIAGGRGGSLYDPSPVTGILCPGKTGIAKAFPWWAFIAGVIAVLALTAFLIRGKRSRSEEEVPENPKVDDDLHTRLIDLMEKRRFFRNKDASLSSVAAELGTNNTYISAVVNGTTGQSFPYFLNGYRIRYAQSLMKENPEIPLQHISEESGFPNETSFLRNFKAHTGLTPSQWKQQNQKKQPKK